MTQSSHLALPYIDAAQAQKHVTHNEALQILDALVHLSVSVRNQITPPPTPAEGQRLLVGAGATGAFAGKTSQIAVFLAGAWTFLAPRAGWRVFVEAENLLLIHDGVAWSDAGLTLRVLQNLSLLGVGAAADGANPLTAKINTALFTAKTVAEGGTGDLRFALNKESAAKTVSQLYQTNFSGRAETGLTGDDHFHVKVSTDGSTWREAINVDPATGYVGFGGVVAPTSALHGATNLAQEGLKFTGTGYTGGTDTVNGPVFMATYNAAGNKQMFIGESQTGNGLRVIGSWLTGFNYLTNSQNALVIGNGIYNVVINSTLKLLTYTVSTLGAGTTGTKSFVTDALNPVFGANVVGGGTVEVPVYYGNGAWKVG
jgi:hypothetical protein